MSLDDVVALRRVDGSDTLSLMEKAPARLSVPPNAPLTCGTFAKPREIVIGGVGGSGIVGDILVDQCRDAIDVPVSVCRALTLPYFVGEQTLFVAISYSGETEETLGLLRQAIQRKASVVTITSGGRLLSLSREERIRHVQVQPGMLTRLALPELVSAAMFVLGAAGIIQDADRLLLETADSVAVEIERVKPTVPSPRNQAKQIAQALVGKLPLLFGSEENVSVLRRFKNELNENSKIPAFYCALPEGYHDDVEGLRTLGQLTQVQPIMVRSLTETDGQKRTRERLYAVLNELHFPTVLELSGSGPNRLSQLFTAITISDYVSVYLAVLRRVDPTELTLIPDFRKAMRGI